MEFRRNIKGKKGCFFFFQTVKDSQDKKGNTKIKSRVKL